MLSKRGHWFIFAAIIMITLLIVTGLVFAMYDYHNEMNYYRVDNCYIANCTNMTYPDNVTNTTITFYLNLSNETNYTKTDWTTNIMWSNYCFHQKQILCYYDDRHIFDSLRLFERYLPDEAGLAIIILVMGLSIMVVATALGCQFLFYPDKD